MMRKDISTNLQKDYVAAGYEIANINSVLRIYSFLKAYAKDDTNKIKINNDKKMLKKGKIIAPNKTKHHRKGNFN